MSSYMNVVAMALLPPKDCLKVIKCDSNACKRADFLILTGKKQTVNDKYISLNDHSPACVYCVSGRDIV